MKNLPLPSGWIWTQLGDLLQSVSALDPARTPDASFTYFDISSIDNELGIAVAPKAVTGALAPSRARQAVKPDDILFSTVRPNLRAIAQVPQSDNPVASTGFCVLRAAKQVTPKYLFFMARSDWFLNQVLPLQRGVSYPAVRDKDILSQPVPLAPAGEQIRIVAKLEELLSDLDAGVAELKAAQKKLQQYRQSLLKAAVDGSLTADWRAKNPPQESGADLLTRILKERRARWEAKQLAKLKEQGKAPPKGWQTKYPEPVTPDLAELPPLPKDWAWASLDMLGEIASGVAKGTKLGEGTTVRQVPYLRVANVQRGYLDLKDVKTILATDRDIEELRLEDGDVLFNEGGDRDKLGRGWVWRNEIENCIHQNHVFRFRPFLSDTLSEFVSHHGNTFGKTWFQKAGKQTTNLASINMGMLRAFPVPVAPSAEQKEVLHQLSALLEALDEQDKAVDRGLKQSAAQRQNILRAAFSGQLVPQDPNDEPASVLLARIRAEREQQAATKKPRATKPRKAA